MYNGSIYRQIKRERERQRREIQTAENSHTGVYTYDYVYVRLPKYKINTRPRTHQSTVRPFGTADDAVYQNNIFKKPPHIKLG